MVSQTGFHLHRDHHQCVQNCCERKDEDVDGDEKDKESLARRGNLMESFGKEEFNPWASLASSRGTVA